MTGAGVGQRCEYLDSLSGDGTLSESVMFPSSGLRCFGPPPSDTANEIPGAVNGA